MLAYVRKDACRRARRNRGDVQRDVSLAETRIGRAQHAARRGRIVESEGHALVDIQDLELDRIARLGAFDVDRPGQDVGPVTDLRREAVPEVDRILENLAGGDAEGAEVRDRIEGRVRRARLVDDVDLDDVARLDVEHRGRVDDEAPQIRRLGRRPKMVGGGILALRLVARGSFGARDGRHQGRRRRGRDRDLSDPAASRVVRPSLVRVLVHLLYSLCSAVGRRGRHRANRSLVDSTVIFCSPFSQCMGRAASTRRRRAASHPSRDPFTRLDEGRRASCSGKRTDSCPFGAHANALGRSQLPHRSMLTCVSSSTGYRRSGEQEPRIVGVGGGTLGCEPFPSDPCGDPHARPWSSLAPCRSARSARTAPRAGCGHGRHRERLHRGGRLLEESRRSVVRAA
jgi:hypothetical protein